MPPPLTRLLLGVAVAAAIAFAARRARSLSSGGAAAAVVVGVACVAAGWAWGGLLIAFFVASTALSRYRAAQKEARTGGVVAKGGERDAVQVLANGGLFALAAVGSLVHPSPLWLAAGGGALAAATADTWGTEIGTLAGRPPRSILDGHLVPPGTSGGVTSVGTIGSLAGAAFVALLAWLAAREAPTALAILAGGFGGAVADSLLGATLQARRWCDRCDMGTERDVHDCGAPTRAAGGVRWLGNDAVNALSGVAGAILALAMHAALT